MFIVTLYSTAVIFCIITMLCWGSWANSQKLAEQNWRFELFYWDYVLGIVITSVIFAVTLGSIGAEGRSFVQDLSQADGNNVLFAMLGGVVFNAANILLVAAIAIVGMSVAFPVGIGIALVLGVVVNYIATPLGNARYLFLGVALVTFAIIFDALAYRQLSAKRVRISYKGIFIAVVSGILMGSFYRFVASSMVSDFVVPEAGKLTPYTAVFYFSIGILISNLLFNTILMKKPIEGSPVSYSAYFSGSAKNHLIGILGGLIWSVGMAFSIIASGEAGFAISYGLGQGATLIAAFWGVFIWKEFKGASIKTNWLLFLMFVSFLVGLGFIIYSRIV